VGFGKIMLLSLSIFAGLALCIYQEKLTPNQAAFMGSSWTFFCFLLAARQKAKAGNAPILKEDRLWAGLLAACAVFMLFSFY